MESLDITSFGFGSSYGVFAIIVFLPRNTVTSLSRVQFLVGVIETL